MKLKNKLILSSGIIILLLLFIGIFSIRCLIMVDSGYSDSYIANAESLPSIAAVGDEILSLKICVRDAVDEETRDPEHISSIMEQK